MIAAAALLLLVQAENAEPDQVCDDPQSQLALNTCAGMDFEQADARLNEQWQETVAYMKARDVEINPVDSFQHHIAAAEETAIDWIVLGNTFD